MSDRDTVSIDELADGKLPSRLIKAIEDTEITVDEMMEWYESRSKTRISFTTKKGLSIRINRDISTKTLLILLGAILVPGSVGYLVISSLLR